jgi:hypothetical protein
MTDSFDVIVGVGVAFARALLVIRASVAYELASLMIIDDAERIERRMRLWM